MIPRALAIAYEYSRDPADESPAEWEARKADWEAEYGVLEPFEMIEEVEYEILQRSTLPVSPLR